MPPTVYEFCAADQLTSNPAFFGLRSLKSLFSMIGLLSIFCMLLTSTQTLCAEEEKPKNAYESAWNDVSEFIRRREYGSAIAKLDSLSREQDLRAFGQQLDADKKAITSLQVLERIVLEQAAELEEGSTVEISGIGYTVVRYEKSTKGDGLILKSKSLGRETKKLIADLPSGTWVELAEADLKSLDNPSLTLGIFLGFDRIADRKAARKLLNEAAADGENVTPWLTRLDADETTKKIAGNNPKGNDDPLVGKWSLNIGIWPASAEVRKNGTGTLNIDPRTIAAMKAKSGIDRSAFQSNTLKWEKLKDNTYRITMQGGITVDGVTVDGDRVNFRDGNKWTREVGGK
jgi:uncharacterized protein YciI